jgi:hypothetical protein
MTGDELPVYKMTAGKMPEDKMTNDMLVDKMTNEMSVDKMAVD